MWLGLTKEEFKDTAFYINSFWRRSLEGNYDQVHTLGPNQWLGKKVINIFEISITNMILYVRKYNKTNNIKMLFPERI